MSWIQDSRSLSPRSQDLGFKILVLDHRICIGFSFLVLGSQDHWIYDSRSLSQIIESRIQFPCPRIQDQGFIFLVLDHKVQDSRSLSQIIGFRIQDPCLRSYDLWIYYSRSVSQIIGSRIQYHCPRSQIQFLTRCCLIGNWTQDPDSLSQILGFRFLVLDHIFRFQIPFQSTQDSGSRFLFIAHRIQVPGSFLQHTGFRIQIFCPRSQVSSSKVLVLYRSYELSQDLGSIMGSRIKNWIQDLQDIEYDLESRIGQYIGSRIWTRMQDLEWYLGSRIGSQICKTTFITIY